MTEATTLPDLTAAFDGLLQKYAVDRPPNWLVTESVDRPDQAGGSLALFPGWALLDAREPVAGVPLLPWRNERRFVELKGLVAGQTIDPVVMCRFACMTCGTPMSLSAILYREFDLAEWLVGSPIVSLAANVTEGRVANVIARLADGVVCSVEAATTLPPGSIPERIDRHELIARRGVASDRVVDTQVPQSSIYLYSEHGPEQFTDTDAELFGLENDEAALVRAAYEAARAPATIETLQRRHRRLVGLVETAFDADRERKCLTVQGEDS